jgi:putative IMPACT (imprinted ancient) family translation regulator
VNESTAVWKHDNDDDGEDAAGSRLAHLLDMRQEDGAFVVVSRWFGGIHLGPKRFAHITNVAGKLLVDWHAADSRH